MSITSNSLAVETSEKRKDLLCLSFIFIAGVSTCIALFIAGYQGYNFLLSILSAVAIRAMLRYVGQERKKRSNSSRKNNLESITTIETGYSPILLAKRFVIPLLMYALGYGISWLI